MKRKAPRLVVHWKFPSGDMTIPLEDQIRDFDEKHARMLTSDEPSLRQTGRRWFARRADETAIAAAKAVALETQRRAAGEKAAAALRAKGEKTRSKIKNTTLAQDLKISPRHFRRLKKKT